MRNGGHSIDLGCTTWLHFDYFSVEVAVNISTGRRKNSTQLGLRHFGFLFSRRAVDTHINSSFVKG